MWHKCICFGEDLHEVYQSVMIQMSLDQTNHMSQQTMPDNGKQQSVSLSPQETGETPYNADLPSVIGFLPPVKLYGISA